jgi:tRNA A-37 threonylcarbamoyl transferase component Bud32
MARIGYTGAAEKKQEALMLPAIEQGMTFPFRLEVEGIGALECLQAARILPGRRLVCRARLDGQIVYAKLYTGSRAERDWQHEQNGSVAMQMRGIRTPQLLGSAHLADVLVLIYEALEPAEGIAALYAKADSGQQAMLRQQCVNLIAQLHNASLLHTDPHLDNFLVCNELLYVIDAGSVRYQEKRPSRSEAEDNLAVLLAQFDVLEINEVESLYGLYLGERGLESMQADIDNFIQRLQSARDYRARKYLKKIFRECSAFVVEHSFERRVVFKRDYDNEVFRELFADPDRFIEANNTFSLKAGNTSTVVELGCCGRRVVIKRYNVKHLWHGVRRMLRRTRAARSWCNAQRLEMLHIPTATAVGFIEKRFGPLRGSSYFIMQAVPGTRADHYFVDSSIPLETRREQAGAMMYVLERVAAAGLVHGDYKASNFMITDEGPVLLDLDAMHQPGSARAFRRGLQKDLQRFLQNWQGNAEVEKMFAEGVKKLAEQYDV